jgi:hypothetical protein
MITIKDIYSEASITDNSNAIQFALNERKGYPQKVVKPSLKNNPTSQEAKEFAENLEKYEKEIEDYNTRKREVQEYNSEIEGLIIDFIKEESGLNSIPEQYREKVYYYAWQQSHSDGYYSVFCTIQNLVEIFE